MSAPVFMLSLGHVDKEASPMRSSSGDLACLLFLQGFVAAGVRELVAIGWRVFVDQVGVVE